MIGIVIRKQEKKYSIVRIKEERRVCESIDMLETLFQIDSCTVTGFASKEEKHFAISARTFFYFSICLPRHFDNGIVKILDCCFFHCFFEGQFGLEQSMSHAPMYARELQ